MNADLPPRAGRHRTTLADIAARAEVSVAAVSQALNSPPGNRISDDLRARIHAIARELDYRPNLTARTLRTATGAAVGFVSDAVTTTRFASGLISGALEATQEHDRFLLIVEAGRDDDDQRRAVDALLDRGVDAIIFAAMKSHVFEPPPLPDGLPAIALNLVSTQLPSVLPDEREAGARAVESLRDAGRLGATVLLGARVDGDADADLSVTARRRISGIADALGGHPTPVVEAPCAEWEPEEGYTTIRRILDAGTPMTSILALNDRLAAGAYQALTETGRRIPTDVAVLSFDDDEIAGFLHPGLSTIAIPHHAMGRAAVERLRASAGGGESLARPSEVLIPMPLRARGSL